MASDPFASASPLIVYIDFKSPYAFVAVRPTRALAAELGIEIDWRPLVLDIPSYLGSAKLGADGNVVESKRSPSQWSAVRYAYKDARRYAALSGLTVRGTTKIWDSTLAGMGLEWAKAQGAAILDRYIDRVYERFWRRELDIEDVAVIGAVLVESGADARGFADAARGEARARFEATQREIFAAGIFGVPGYVLEREYYFGREHLPRIRWLLAGREGAAPDVAYRRFSARGADLTESKPPPASPVLVCIDFANPQSLLALEPTRELEARLGVAFDWLPLRVPAPSASSARAGDERGARHRRIRAAYLEGDLARYARARGIEIADMQRAPDTALASLGLLWLRSLAPELASAYVARIFESVWRQGADPASTGVVEDTLTALGTDPASFRDDVARRGAEPLAELERELSEAGVFAAPAYVVDGEPFIGRQHLPMLEWLLTGRAGAPPI